MSAAIDNIIATLSTIRLDLFIGAVTLFAASVILAGLRWRTVLKAMGYSPTLSETILVYLAGIFVNNTTPASRLGGEACRALLIRQRAHVKSIAAVMSILYERLSEIIPIAIMFLIALPAASNLIFQTGSTASKYAVAVASIICIVIIIFHIPAVRKHTKKIREQIRTHRINIRTFLTASSLSALIWIQDVLRIMILAAAFGVELTTSQGAAASALILLGGLVPTIGGLGAIEGGLVAILYFFGINIETAIAITAAERMISYVMSTGAGGIALATLGGKKLWKDLRSRSSVTGISQESEGSNSTCPNSPAN